MISPKLLSPARRRACVEHVKSELGLSERRICLVLGQHRLTHRRLLTTADDEAALTADIIALACEYGHYGYRRIAALLANAGWVVNIKRVRRIWLFWAQAKGLLTLNSETIISDRYQEQIRVRTERELTRTLRYLQFSARAW